MKSILFIVNSEEYSIYDYHVGYETAIFACKIYKRQYIVYDMINISFHWHFPGSVFQN